MSTITNFKILRELDRRGNDVKVTNAMRLCATELISSTGVSGFQIFKLVFCIHNICVYTLKF